MQTFSIYTLLKFSEYLCSVFFSIYNLVLKKKGDKNIFWTTTLNYKVYNFQINARNMLSMNPSRCCLDLDPKIWIIFLCQTPSYFPRLL